MLLKENNIDFVTIEYLKTPLSKEDILLLANKLGKRPKEFVRRSETDFKENNIASHLEDDQRLASSMEEFPKIMERPIFMSGESAVVGRPPEKVLELLDL
jgi:arsenate reductase